MTFHCSLFSFIYLPFKKLFKGYFALRLPFFLVFLYFIFWFSIFLFVIFLSRSSTKKDGWYDGSVPSPAELPPPGACNCSVSPLPTPPPTPPIIPPLPRDYAEFEISLQSLMMQSSALLARPSQGKTGGHLKWVMLHVVDVKEWAGWM